MSFASIRQSASKISIISIISFLAPEEQEKLSIFFCHVFLLTCVTSWSHKTI